MTQAIEKYNPQESIQLQAVAGDLFASGMFPNVKTKAGAFTVVEYGFELGMKPVTALQNISVIQGKMALSAGLMLALAVKNGVAFQVAENTDKRCRIIFTRNLNGVAVKYDASFDMEEAKKAGLVKSGSAWDKFPADMLWARAVSRGIRKIAPDVVSGAYTPEEVQEFTAPEINPPAVQAAPDVVEGEIIHAADAPPTPKNGKSPEWKKAMGAILDVTERAKIPAAKVTSLIQDITDGHKRSASELSLDEIATLLNCVQIIAEDAKLAGPQDAAFLKEAGMEV